MPSSRRHIEEARRYTELAREMLQGDRDQFRVSPSELNSALQASRAAAAQIVQAQVATAMERQERAKEAAHG